MKVGKTIATAPATRRSLTVRKDPKDIKDRPYLPPPVGLQAAFPTDEDIAKFLPAYSRAGMSLNQGQEGACTGFVLACAVNYLRWAKDGYPKKMDSVSPRMFYNCARRYDEYGVKTMTAPVAGAHSKAGLTTAYAWKATGLSATPNCCNPSTAMPNVLPTTRWACTTALNWRPSPTCRRRFSQPVRCMCRPTPTAAGTP